MKRVLLIGFDPATVDFSDPVFRFHRLLMQAKFANGKIVPDPRLVKIVEFSGLNLLYLRLVHHTLHEVDFENEHAAPHCNVRLGVPSTEIGYGMMPRSSSMTSSSGDIKSSNGLAAHVEAATVPRFGPLETELQNSEGLARNEEREYRASTRSRSSMRYAFAQWAAMGDHNELVIVGSPRKGVFAYEGTSGSVQLLN